MKYPDLVHQELDDHDDPLEPLDDLEMGCERGCRHMAPNLLHGQAEPACTLLGTCKGLVRQWATLSANGEILGV